MTNTSASPTHGWRIGSAFRSPPDCELIARDFVRLLPQPHGVLLLMANAGECGFSTRWGDGARLALDLFEASTSTEREAESLLNRGLDAVVAEFVNAAQRIDDIGGSDDFGGGPHATMMAVMCSVNTVQATWIGADAALLARGFQTAWTTEPHDLRAEFRAAGRDLPPGPVPDVLARCIGSRCNSQRDHAHTAVVVGDTVVLANAHVWRQLGAQAITYLAAVSLCPQETAEALVSLAYEVSDVPFAAAIVARREDGDLPASLGSLVQASRHPVHGSPKVESCATLHGVLPLAFDMGGVMALDTDGRAVMFDPADDEPPRPLRHITAMLVMRQRLAAMRPELAFLALDRADAPVCDECREWRSAGISSAEGTCPFCNDLGWIAPQPPAVLRRYFGLLGDVLAPAPQTCKWWQFWKR